MAGLSEIYFPRSIGEPASRQQNRQIIIVYNLFRLVLALILLISFYGTTSVGASDPELFLHLVIGYALFNLATLLLPARLTEMINPQFYAAAVVLIDIVVLEILCFASGGMGSGIAPLLLLPVASGSVLFGMRISTFFAAVASIALFYGEFYHILNAPPNTPEYYVQASLLGLLLFSTALGIQSLSKRVREKDLINRRQANSIEALQQINEQIIRRMETGIVVLDNDEHIVHCNDAARKLLHLPDTGNNDTKIPLQLHEQLLQWLQQPENHLARFRLSQGGPELQANFAYLQTGNSTNILIFLEDNTELSSRAQHLKLMSLGRLTASIAHEIRNPLWAIAHAAQLLGESSHLQRDESKLLGIINNHSQRVNTIIQNVLELSRHKPSDIARIELGNWLQGFGERLKNAYRNPVHCQVITPSVPVWIRFSPSQLEQVLTNLCDNGLRYSQKQTGESTITLDLGLDETTQSAWLDVIDEGPGVKDSDTEQVFEPFFTTESGGTGLGLFICKELCEANNTRLFFQRAADGRSAFRLGFPHPDRPIF
jgi:two-component system sensor histidine kinase PilS (NtrC family)